jgi:YbgC/YbaW family acyl-CoA thioester hydrolase
MSTHKFPFTIAFADTDAQGMVYHARYIEIAERARMNWLRFTMPPDGDIGFVLKELSMKYIRPLRPADDIVVETSIIKLGNASMTLEHKFVKDNEVYAILTGTAAYLGGNLKPKRIPDEILDKCK